MSPRSTRHKPPWFGLLVCSVYCLGLLESLQGHGTLVIREPVCTNPLPLVLLTELDTQPPNSPLPARVPRTSTCKPRTVRLRLLIPHGHAPLPCPLFTSALLPWPVIYERPARVEASYRGGRRVADQRVTHRHHYRGMDGVVGGGAVAGGA